MQIGDTLPKFKLPTHNGQYVSDEDLLGSWSVIYFYPKDNTPGCTKEAIGFSEHLDEFSKLNTRIIGISRDSAKSHASFIEKHNLKITLLSDEDGAVCDSFGSWVEKNMYGRKYMGIDRSTFLIDSKGLLVEKWNKVRVPGHVEKVLERLKAVQSQ